MVGYTENELFGNFGSVFSLVCISVKPSTSATTLRRANLRPFPGGRKFKDVRARQRKKEGERERGGGVCRVLR
jgi:hypothetical protein